MFCLRYVSNTKKTEFHYYLVHHYSCTLATRAESGDANNPAHDGSASLPQPECNLSQSYTARHKGKPWSEIGEHLLPSLGRIEGLPRYDQQQTALPR